MTREQWSDKEFRAAYYRKNRNAALRALVKGGEPHLSLFTHHQRAHAYGVHAVAGRGYKHNGHWKHL